MIRSILAGVAVLALAACNSGPGNSNAAAVQVAGKSAPAGTEWATTVALTKDGGYRMGNPDAPIKLIGVGEGVDDLQPFDARAFSRSLVGLED